MRKLIFVKFLALLLIISCVFAENTLCSRKPKGMSQKSGTSYLVKSLPGALFVGEHLKYIPKYSVKVQKVMSLKTANLIDDLRKGYVPIKEWVVEEDEDTIYFISRNSYIPENKNTIIKAMKYVCYSHIADSKYSKGIIFNNKGIDPLLEEGSSYIFADIEVGYVVQFDKDSCLNGEIKSPITKWYIKKAKLVR